MTEAMTGLLHRTCFLFVAIYAWFPCTMDVVPYFYDLALLLLIFFLKTCSAKFYP
jgi:hypothetical protein